MGTDGGQQRRPAGDMIADVLVDKASRWSVLAFASAHVLGMLTHHPVPWSASLTAVSLLLVACAATARAATGTLRSVALLGGLTAAAGLVAEVDYRGGGIGWPFFLTAPPAGGGPAWTEATLATAAVLGLSAAALLPEHGTEERLRALRGRLETRLRTWYAGRRTHILDLLEPPPVADPTTGTGPAVLDLGVLEQHHTPDGVGGGFGIGGAGGEDGAQPRRRAGWWPRGTDLWPRGSAWWRRDSGWWRPRLVAAGIVAVTALVVVVASLPLWRQNLYCQIPVVDTGDRTGMLVATVPALLAVIAGTVAACRSLLMSRRAAALAAMAFVALAVPVAWERGGDFRFSPDPPPSVLILYSYVYVEVTDEPGGLPPRQVHPGFPNPAAGARGPAGWVDGSWWSQPVDWDEVGDGVVGALAIGVLLAVTVALLPPPRRPDLLP